MKGKGLNEEGEASLSSAVPFLDSLGDEGLVQAVGIIGEGEVDGCVAC